MFSICLHPSNLLSIDSERILKSEILAIDQAILRGHEQ